MKINTTGKITMYVYIENEKELKNIKIFNLEKIAKKLNYKNIYIKL